MTLLKYGIHSTFIKPTLVDILCTTFYQNWMKKCIKYGQKFTYSLMQSTVLKNKFLQNSKCKMALCGDLLCHLSSKMVKKHGKHRLKWLCANIHETNACPTNFCNQLLNQIPWKSGEWFSCW